MTMAGCSCQRTLKFFLLLLASTYSCIAEKINLASRSRNLKALTSPAIPDNLIYAKNLTEFNARLASANVESVDPRELKRLTCLFIVKQQLRSVVVPFIEGKNAILLDQVFHWNIGDSFIQHGEHIFLEEMGTPNEIPCTAVDYFAPCNKTRIREAIKNDPRDPILLIRGGGNYGDLYFVHRSFVNEYVQSFRDIPMLLLPQSVHYANISKARRDAVIRSVHPNYVMLARDFVSLGKMKKFFPKQKSFLSPDFAQYIGPVDRAQCRPSVDVLILARNSKDMEHATRVGNLSRAVGDLDLANLTYRVMDWFDYEVILKKYGMTLPEDPLEYPEFRTRVGIKMLCEGGLIITDRLHATIMSTLMGLPYIYLDNMYGKVASYRAAIYQPIAECSDENLRAHKASSWGEAVGIAVEVLRK